jgi:hypothetical protein
MSAATERLNKVISIILYLALVAAVCVLTPILEISTTPEPYRYPEALKAAIYVQLEDILRRGGYYDAEVLISGNTCHVYTTDVPAPLIAQDIMRERKIVETLNKWGIRFLEVRRFNFLPGGIIYELKYSVVGIPRPTMRPGSDKAQEER